MEIRPIPSLPDYGVTRDGRVFRLTPWARMPKHFVLPRAIRPTPNKNRNGYLQFGRGYKVHRCVAEAWIPNPNNYLWVAHNDGNPAHNHVNNLRWDSIASNLADKKSHGTQNRGETTPWHKLSETEVKRARKLRSSGLRLCEIAPHFGVDRSVLGRAIRGKTWAHV